MAQLWGGRFTKATDQLVYDFNASIGFDQRFFSEDIMGSKAHVKMLAKQGILTEEERDEILVGLEGIEKDVADGKRLNEEKAKELKDSLAQIEEQLTTAKTEISEKVHTENVKCYRNISDLFRSMDERLDKLTVMESRMHPVRIFSLMGMILGIVNLVVLLLVLLVSVGVIAF